MTMRLAVCIVSTLVLGTSAIIHVPNITQSPSDLSTVDGKIIQITCRVFGTPKPEVKWVKDGLELTGSRYKILDVGDLEIENVTFQDAGIYTCYASNTFGEVNASACLTVKEHTKITDEPEDYEVARGSNSIAKFRCKAIADPTLPLTIDWLSNGEPIDFKKQPRFVQINKYTLIIIGITELDSGVYTCIARTDLDVVRAQATLMVQTVPNAPRLVSTKCNPNSAIVEWIPMGDNRAPILHYIIQYNTTFTPDIWETSTNYVPATDLRYEVPMSPWANYTFHVLALNKIGLSLPSPHGDVCTTEADVPYKNPDNVMGKGTTPQNLVISWTTMPEIEHNGPKFLYKIFYKRDIPGENWVTVDVHDWKKNNVVVENQPTYQKYRIKVVAINEKGECRIPADEVIGYSGEDVPLQAPDNFTLNEIKSGTTAQLSWSPVPEETVRGELQGYKIQTWTDKDGEEGMREIDIRGGDKTHALIAEFVPYSKNFARILAYNGGYAGPASDTLSFDMPEGVPGRVLDFEVLNMGSSALFLKWTRPAETNGILTGYKIRCQVSNKVTDEETLLETKPHVVDAQATSTKLSALIPATLYIVTISATTRIGEGIYSMIVRRTWRPHRPDIPRFTWEAVQVEHGYSNIKVIWLPNLYGNPGSYFFVKYKLKGETIFLETKPEFQSTHIEIRFLQSGAIYTMSIVAVDGDYMTESVLKEIETNNEGPYST